MYDVNELGGSMPTTDVENNVEGIISVNEMNTRIFLASQKLMEASIEILPVSSVMSGILHQLGDTLLEEVNTDDPKMTEQETQSIIDDILSMKV